MFVPQEDYFPGEFQNVYLIKLTTLVPKLPYKLGEQFEVLGHDMDSFLWKKKSTEIIFPKECATIIKKMLKRTR